MGSDLYFFIEDEESDNEYARINLGSGDCWYMYVRPFLLVHYVSTENQSLKCLLRRFLQNNRAISMTSEEENLLLSNLPPGLCIAFMQTGRFYDYGPGEIQSFWHDYLIKTRKIFETQSEEISDILNGTNGELIKEIICDDERMDLISKAIAQLPLNASATAG